MSGDVEATRSTYGLLKQNIFMGVNFLHPLMLQRDRRFCAAIHGPTLPYFNRGPAKLPMSRYTTITDSLAWCPILSSKRSVLAHARGIQLGCIMRLHFFERILWIVVVASTLTRLVEATAIPACACLGALCTISDTKVSGAIAVEQIKPLSGREYQHLGRGRSLRYKSFFPFKPSWEVALSLCYFWTEIQNQVSNTA